MPVDHGWLIQVEAVTEYAVYSLISDLSCRHSDEPWPTEPREDSVRFGVEEAMGIDDQILDLSKL